jgi:hypothetical protein
LNGDSFSRRENSIKLAHVKGSLEASDARVKNGIYVSALKYASSFDHSALVSGIARSYSQRGIVVKSEPPLPGGKRADLAVSLDNTWTYIEVKTRANGIAERHRRSYRQDFLRELLRLRAHSLKQLPKKESSLVVLSTSISANRRKALSKIDLARSFTGRIFDHDSEKVLGLMIFAPFRAPSASSGWRYASTLIPNPKLKTRGDGFERLASVQL